MGSALSLCDLLVDWSLFDLILDNDVKVKQIEESFQKRKRSYYGRFRKSPSQCLVTFLNF